MTDALAVLVVAELAVGDTATVLRDGRLVKTTPVAGQTARSLIEAMLGQSLESAVPDKPPLQAGAPVVLDVRGLRRAPRVLDVSLEVRAGEIVGVSGLVGSGRTEMARTLIGADPADAGTVLVAGSALRSRHPGEALRAGLAMLPESRKEQGLMMGRSVLENTTLPHLRAFSRATVTGGRRERAAALETLTKVDVRGFRLARPVATLSGGNQQKVLFARWVLRPPRVLIVDEPTRGVDVGAKRAIYRLVADLARNGIGILLISSETEEITGLCHRVYVMRGGATVAEFPGSVGAAELTRAAFATAEPPA